MLTVRNVACMFVGNAVIFLAFILIALHCNNLVCAVQMIGLGLTNGFILYYLTIQAAERRGIKKGVKQQVEERLNAYEAELATRRRLASSQF